MADDREQFLKILDAQEAAPVVIPNAEEARNGWTPETLTAYIAEQKAASGVRLNPHSVMRRKPRPTTTNYRYSPLKWPRK